MNSIYAPNVRLFNYHLKTVRLTDFSESHLNLESILEYYQKSILEYYQSLLECQKILKQNHQSINLSFRDDFSQMLASGLANFDLIYNPRNRGIHRFLFSSKYKGFCYPQFLNDTYSFSLTIYYPQKLGNDGITFSDLYQLNPPKEFFTGIYSKEQDKSESGFHQTFWGSTVFLSGFVAQRHSENMVESFQVIADNILKSFLNLESMDEAPPFYQSGEFLGGYIYEYKSVFQQHQYGQILILVIFDEITTHKINNIQWDLSELFLYDHKNRQIFLDSRKEYQDIQEKIKIIEEKIRKFPENITQNVLSNFSREDLSLLKREIKSLLNLSLGYSQKMRSLRTFQNTIEINQQNYLDVLSRMEVKSQSSLGILRDKAKQIFERFQQQIAVDLVYLQQGERLLDTATNTIRGLVEIDQAERDRQLQDKLQALGVGIAAGAIVASTTGLLTHPWQWPPKLSTPVHPLVIAVFLSSTIAICAGTLTHFILKAYREDLTLTECVRNLLNHDQKASARTGRKRRQKIEH